MARYVAFFRAVNVGARRVPMATARAVVAEVGCTDVASFANSGNLIFSATDPADEVQSRIRAAMEAEFGFEVTTFVRTSRRVREMVSAEPFGAIAAGHTYFGLFTLTPLSTAEKHAVERMSNERDEVVVRGRDVHWLIRAKSTETSLGPKRWRDVLPGNPTTARNMNLLRKVAARLSA